MFDRIRGQMTPSMAVAMTALVFSTTGSAFAAKTLIDGSDIKNGTITSADIKDGSLSTRDIEEGSINLDRLSDGTQRRINEKPRDGKDGVNGVNGVNGKDGANGAAGAKGDKGEAGADAAHAVKALVPFKPDESVEQNGEWRSYKGTTIDAAGIKFGPFANGTDWTSAYTYAIKGARLSDIANLAYSTHYTGGGGTGAAPYVILVTEDGDHVAFTPSTQAGVTPKAGVSQRWVVTHGTVRYNEDSVGTDITWDALLADHGTEKVDYISVQAGNAGAYSEGSTSHVRNVTLEVTGAEATFANVVFGS